MLPPSFSPCPSLLLEGTLDLLRLTQTSSPGQFNNSLNPFYRLHFSLLWNLTRSQALGLRMSGEEGVFSVYSETILSSASQTEGVGLESGRIWLGLV